MERVRLCVCVGETSRGEEQPPSGSWTTRLPSLEITVTHKSCASSGSSKRKVQMSLRVARLCPFVKDWKPPLKKHPLTQSSRQLHKYIRKEIARNKSQYLLYHVQKHHKNYRWCSFSEVQP